MKHLRGNLTAQENRNNDLEKAIIKKESDFEIMLKEIDKESKKMREEIVRKGVLLKLIFYYNRENWKIKRMNYAKKRHNSEWKKMLFSMRIIC